MRRVLVSSLAVPAFLLSACGGDEPSVDEPAAPAETGQDPMEATEEMAPAETETPAEPAEETEAPAESAEETGAPADDATQTSEGGDTAEQTGAAGGADGEAAAARTEEFFLAVSTASPELCNLIVGPEGDAPINASEQDLALCEEQLVPQLEQTVTPEIRSVFELVEVSGAQVDGDTATVGAENFNEIFAQALGDQEIILLRFDDQWYVDIENSGLFSPGGVE